MSPVAPKTSAKTRLLDAALTVIRAKGASVAAPVGAVMSPRTEAAVVMRADADLLAAASVLIMDGPGRKMRARCNRGHTGSGR